MKKSILCLCVVGLMAGCSTTKQSEVTIPNGTKSAEQFKNDEIKMPEWYLAVPKEDGAIYAAASEMSSDLQFAIDKAAMSAKREIAFKLQNDFSQKYKEYATESNYSNNEKLSKESERLVIAESTHINLVGVQRVKSEVIREGNKYRAFILIRYGLDESNRIHANYMAKERRANAKTEMDKFEKELKPQSRVEPVVVPEQKQETGFKPANQFKSGELLGPQIQDPDVREKVLEAYKKPDTVILQRTIE